jgi:hypothetical protein
MHPPQWVVTEIERVNPWARLAWSGEERAPDEPLNKGSFAIIDLYPRRMADRTYKTLWDGRGPVFGGDYDRLTRVPVWIENVHPRDVFNGAIVPRIRYLMTDIRERVEVGWSEARKQRREETRELAGQAGEHLYWSAQKSTDPAPTVADKFVSNEDKARTAGDWQHKDETEKAPPLNAIAMS